MILAFSVIPIVWEWWRHRRAQCARGRGPRPRRPPRPRHLGQRRRPALTLAISAAASSSAFVSTARTSRPTSASGFSPSGLRSIAHTTGSTMAPSSRSVGRVAYRPAGGDHVLDQGDPPAVDVRALGELAGAVRLGLLAHEQCRQAGRGLTGRDRDAAHLEAAEQLGVCGQQLRISRATRRSSARAGLEEVLVEVLVRHLPGSERELAGEAAAGSMSRARSGSLVARLALWAGWGNGPHGPDGRTTPHPTARGPGLHRTPQGRGACRRRTPPPGVAGGVAALAELTEEGADEVTIYAYSASATTAG